VFTHYWHLKGATCRLMPQSVDDGQVKMTVFTLVTHRVTFLQGIHSMEKHPPFDCGTCDD
jgi:hypothetical protein